MRLFSNLLLVACIKTLVFNGEGLAKDRLIEVRDVQHVRKILLVGGVNDEKAFANREYLIYMGEKVFPAYLAILSDPKSTPDEIFGVFCILNVIEADRRPFIRYAVLRLTDTHSGIRNNAVRLLREIGSQAEASPVVALLSDEREEIVSTAAWTLAAIGGLNELVAMDAWLRGVSYRDKAGIREDVKRHRDMLKKRLDEDKDPKKRADRIQKCWKELRVTEYMYPEVHRAVWDLTAYGNESLALLKNHLHPVSPAEQKNLDQILADLDCDNFEGREAATRELSRGILAEFILEKSLADHPSPERRKRLEAILEDLSNWKTRNPELLRQVRAIWVLQQIGTPEAKALLEKLAAGAPSARLTQKAKDALESLKKR